MFNVAEQREDDAWSQEGLRQVEGSCDRDRRRGRQHLHDHHFLEQRRPQDISFSDAQRRRAREMGSRPRGYDTSTFSHGNALFFACDCNYKEKFVYTLFEKTDANSLTRSFLQN